MFFKILTLRDISRKQQILRKTTGPSLLLLSTVKKRSLWNFFNFFKNHSYNFTEFSKLTRSHSVNFSLDILPPSKISYGCEILWLHMGFWKAWQAVILFTLLVVDLIQTSLVIELYLHIFAFSFSWLVGITKRNVKTWKTGVYWDWTQTDCKYLQIAQNFNPVCKF